MNKSIINSLVEEMYITVGRNVKRSREQARLTQLDLAVMMDTQRESISRIENGKTNLKLSTVIQLAQLLEVEPNDLLNVYERKLVVYPD